MDPKAQIVTLYRTLPLPERQGVLAALCLETTSAAPAKDPNQLLTPKDVGRELQLGMDGVYLLLATGRLRSVKSPGGRKYTVRRTDLDAYIEANVRGVETDCRARGGRALRKAA